VTPAVPPIFDPDRGFAIVGGRWELGGTSPLSQPSPSGVRPDWGAASPARGRPSRVTTCPSNRAGPSEGASTIRPTARGFRRAATRIETSHRAPQWPAHGRRAHAPELRPRAATRARSPARTARMDASSRSPHAAAKPSRARNTTTRPHARRWKGAAGTEIAHARHGSLGAILLERRAVKYGGHLARSAQAEGVTECILLNSWA
jgi:hypothetical protein